MLDFATQEEKSLARPMGMQMMAYMRKVAAGDFSRLDAKIVGFGEAKEVLLKWVVTGLLVTRIVS